MSDSSESDIIDKYIDRKDTGVGGDVSDEIDAEHRVD